MRLALTVNGPGESAGWVRPVLQRLYAMQSDLDVLIFCVPDDYATGAESASLSAWFPQAQVFTPKEYLRFALGGRNERNMQADVVQYFGGDLMHAARLQHRFGAKLSTYKFSRQRYARRTQLAMAVDEKNAEQLVAWGIPRNQIQIVGNAAIDAAFDEAQRPADEPDARDGIVILPGSRRYEVEHLVPFFFTMAQRMLRERPSIPIVMAISPFTSLDAIATAVAAGGDARIFAETGRLVVNGTQASLVSNDGAISIPIVRNAMRAASNAALAVTIPGTKVIELAALGVPTLSITPLNAPEKITINGPLTYLDRLPLIGQAVKARIVLAVAKRFTYHTQPNIDAGEAIIPELRGTLTPGRVAREAMNLLDDAPGRAVMSERLTALYASSRGAASRMAELLKGEG